MHSLKRDIVHCVKLQRTFKNLRFLIARKFKIFDGFQTFFSIQPSHTSIRNWQTCELENRIENIDVDYSGYYTYDKQWIKLNGLWHYRLTLYDYILNIPVAEEIALDKEYDTIKEFIVTSTEYKRFYSLTTDGLQEYKSITDKLRVIHQQCISHNYRCEFANQ
ncbi:MAG: hypothetical protein PQ975_00435 [Methanobacterium sp.]